MLLGRLQKLSKRDARSRTRALLERFGIMHAADRQVGTYSGGMRRRLDLAACLVVHRDVVFLDEPTTGLDPASRAEMWGAIEGLVQDGAALLLTTQYLEEADRLADEIVVLSGGRTVAAGTPAQLKARVGDRRVHVSLPPTASWQVPRGCSSDIRSGLMDRLRTLPIARGSVIAGRTVAELVELCAGMVVVALCGLIVGWAPHGTVLETTAGFALLIFMGFAVTWAGVWIGLMVRDPDGADGIAMAIIFPAMFLSGIFVPIAGLPDGLRQIAELNPLTSLATAVRKLWHSPVGPVPDVFTLQHPVLTSLIWGVVLMAIFVPLSIAATADGLLSARQVQPQLDRVAQVHVLGFRAGGLVGVDQHADDPRERARDRDLARAQQRHRRQSHLARGDGGELGVEVGREREDAADEVLDAERVAGEDLAHQLIGRRRGSPRRCSR